MTTTQNQELIRKIASQLGSDADGVVLSAVNALKAQASKHGFTLTELFFFAFADLSALGVAPQQAPLPPGQSTYGTKATQADHDLYAMLERIMKSKGQRGGAFNKLSAWEKAFVEDIHHRFGGAPFGFSAKQKIVLQRIDEKTGAQWADINF